jgi:hypothetical protein
MGPIVDIRVKGPPTEAALEEFMPRCYYIPVLRATQLVSVAALAVAAIIALCVAADWLWHIGWGYPWYSGILLIVYALIAVAIFRGASALIKRASAN